MTTKKNTKSTKAKPARDERGRILPGNTGNAGGRPSLPEDFKAKGPELLRRMMRIAKDAGHEHHYRALEWCAERIYGKATQDVGVHGPALTPGAAALLALVEVRKAKLEEEAKQKEPKP